MCCVKNKRVSLWNSDLTTTVHTYWTINNTCSGYALHLRCFSLIIWTDGWTGRIFCWSESQKCLHCTFSMGNMDGTFTSRTRGTWNSLQLICNFISCSFEILNSVLAVISACIFFRFSKGRRKYKGLSFYCQKQEDCAARPRLAR